MRPFLFIKGRELKSKFQVSLVLVLKVVFPKLFMNDFGQKHCCGRCDFILTSDLQMHFLTSHMAWGLCESSMSLGSSICWMSPLTILSKYRVSHDTGHPKIWLSPRPYINSGT